MTPGIPLIPLTLVALVAFAGSVLNPPAARGAEDNISGSYSSLVDKTAGGLIGQGVFNANGTKLGEISDLVIRKADKVSYAVISIGDKNRKEIAVPYQALKMDSESVNIMLDLTPEDIRDMRDYEPHDFTSIRARSKG